MAYLQSLLLYFALFIASFWSSKGKQCAPTPPPQQAEREVCACGA